MVTLGARLMSMGHKRTVSDFALFDICDRQRPYCAQGHVVVDFGWKERLPSRPGARDYWTRATAADPTGPSGKAAREALAMLAVPLTVQSQPGTPK